MATTLRALARLWRARQLQYTLLRSLMGRHENFWRLTDDGLVHAAKSLRLELTPERRQRLLDAVASNALTRSVTVDARAVADRAGDAGFEAPAAGHVWDGTGRLSGAAGAARRPGPAGAPGKPRSRRAP